MSTGTTDSRTSRYYKAVALIWDMSELFWEAVNNDVEETGGSLDGIETYLVTSPIEDFGKVDEVLELVDSAISDGILKEENGELYVVAEPGEMSADDVAQAVLGSTHPEDCEGVKLAFSKAPGGDEEAYQHVIKDDDVIIA